MGYKDAKDRREYQRKYHARRMSEDPEYAETFRARKAAYRKQRYSSDPEFKERLKAHARKEGAKETSKEASKLRHQNNRAVGPRYPSQQKDSMWGRGLKSLYRMSVAQYKQKLSDQNGACAFCFGDNDGKKLYVDHDHSKPKGEGNRWLLCRCCNIMIGAAKEKPEVLRRAAELLEGYHGST